ncbi:MAG: hypothetical protein KAY22_25940 [Rhizorhabdus sp.]|uniref:hypothetical protein n=1 Tax=Rhizorhabdus sp. TaxID=1968843 RepID=UPI001B5B16F0|nr:hypothetical protein [Rhizorhabdus sp.]MBP8235741.1 hypothetical protein [Rhizorhabdus sp.]
MIRLLTLAPLLLAAGCVTSNDMRSRAPELDATSARSAKDIAGCLGTEWAGKTMMPVTSVPAGDGYAFSSSSNGNVNILVDVIDEGEQRRVKVYFIKAIVSLIPEGDHLKLIRGCL